MIRIKNNITPRLPNEYQEVEYIESTGNQYINTGIPLNQYRKCEMEFSPTLIGATVDERLCIDGGLNNSSQNDVRNLLYIYGGTKKLCLAYGNSSHRIDSVELEINLKYIIEYEMLANSCSLTINGNKYSASHGATLITNGDNVFLFGASNSASNQKPYIDLASMRLYNAKYYNDNDILIRNFIPCYRKSDNKVGLYDLVNNVFYTNAGTGVFLMGEAVGTADANLMPLIGNKKVLKRYIGENLVYQKNGDTFFTSCPFPTSWTEVTTGTKYKATNEYGEWNIWATNYYSTFSVNNAFDTNKSSYWCSTRHTNINTPYEIGIDLPINCLINPSSIYIKSMCASGASSSYYAKVMGYNPSTESWEKLGEFIGATSVTEENLVVSQAIFYSKFKLVMYRTSSNNNKNYVYEFQITSGTLRKEN